MQVADQKKTQIIEAAIAEFQDRGFVGASMDRISERANVSKRTVYNHFENKECLFQAIAESLVDQLNAALEIPYDPDLPIRDSLIRLGWAEGELLTNPCFMRLIRMIMGEIIRDPELAADLTSKMNKLIVFEEFMARATREGKLKADNPKQAGEQFLGLIKAQAFLPNLFAGAVVSKDEMQTIIEESADMIIARYGGKN